MDKVTVYKRDDGKWAWHRKSENGHIVATDGGQGYEDRAEALRMAAELNEASIIEVDPE